MTSSSGAGTSTEPVERFKPTSGIGVGYAGVLLVLLTIGYVAVYVHTTTGLRVALGAALFGFVIWVTQLRPRATAYPERLVLKNSLRDYVIPLALVGDVNVRQTLNVWVGDHRYVCIGIGSSLRSLVKSGDRGSSTTFLMTSRWREYAFRAEQAPDNATMTYETFVVTRIEELVQQAKKASDGEAADRQAAESRWAWPEIAGLVVLGLAFVVSFFL